MFKRGLYVQLDTAGMGGAAGGGTGAEPGGAAAGGSTGAASPGGDNAAAPGAGAGHGTALAAGAAAAGGGAGGVVQAGGTAGVAEHIVPEKFVVKTAAGEIDHAATALKVSEAYGHLEKRFGAGDAPPADASGYKINVPEALADKINAEELAANDGFKDFMAKAHGAGLTQKQLDVVMGDFLERSLALRAAGTAMDEASCEADLRQGEGWKSDTEYRQQVGIAFRAGEAIFGNDFGGIVKDYGNDPRLIRGLASIGKEMQEDMPASPESQAAIQDGLDTLMNSPAYLNGNHPQHAGTVAKVEALTKQVAGSKPLERGRSHSFKSG